MPIKDECGICGRVLPYSYLRRCRRCARLFCRDCMVPEVATGDPTVMFCLNCARRIVSPKPTSKYSALTSYLRFRSSFTDVVKLSFPKIDGVIRDNLPMSAYRDERWWDNARETVQARAWSDAGWKIREVNLKEGYVVFGKAENAQTKRIMRKTAISQPERPFTPAPIRMARARKLSKTKASKLHARIKNIERQKASMTRYQGSFKPKPTHEKRLFKSVEKPK